MSKFPSINFYSIFIFLILFFCDTSFAKIIHVLPNTVIEKNTEYNSDILDLNHGSFIISNNASLTIKNSKISGSISHTNPFLIHLKNGSLILDNNNINVISDNISANPAHPSLFYSIKISQGNVNIVKNNFHINKSYTVGLLTTTRLAISHFYFNDNSISNFHGGLLLQNVNIAHISKNTFLNVSSSNIFILDGNNHLLEKNIILFAGNNNVGDGIDIVDSNSISLINNFISSGSCYSVMIFGSNNILIKRNKIIGGITYAIFITTSTHQLSPSHDHLAELMIHSNNRPSSNISIIDNYLAQNRYGLAADNIDGLTATNNIFIQRFKDSNSRKFWTNNDILLTNISHLTWTNNLYKEAFTQEMGHESEYESTFVLFPLHGGVVL